MNKKYNKPEIKLIKIDNEPCTEKDIDFFCTTWKGECFQFQFKNAIQLKDYGLQCLKMDKKQEYHLLKILN